MRKTYLVFGLAVGLLLLIFSGCVVPPSEILKLNIPNGAYVDPREDLEISWSTEGLPSSSTFVVFLNGESLGEVSTNSYTIPADMLDWGKEYELKIMAKYKGRVFAIRVSVFYTYEGALKLHVVGYTSGSAVEGVKAYVNDEDTGEFTDEKGEMELMIKQNPVDVLLEKEGYALSAVKNLTVVGERDYNVQIRKAQLNPDPRTQKLPDVNIEFYTDSSKATPADLENLTSNPYIVVNVEAANVVNIIYAAAGKIPGSGFFGKRLFVSDTTTLEGYVDIAGLEGEIEIHVVVYDYNDNRVDIVIPAKVTKEGETELQKYEVLKQSSLGKVNLTAYTRRRGIEFYSLPGDIAEKQDTRADVLGIKPQAAPEGGNLWIEVLFVDYDAASSMKLIDSSAVERPEAYVVYRSFDGTNWEKAGVVAETPGNDGLFRDADPRLEPGKKVYYKVSAYYRDGESTPTYLGYVVPLDSFNVELKNPPNGARNVSRDPTFVWEPTNDAFAVIPEDVGYYGSYVYTLWIYDLVQSENHLYPLTSSGHQLILQSPEATEMSLEFSSVAWAIIALDFGKIFYYPGSQLEPNKTYEWAVDLAYAYAVFSDEEGNVNVAYSMAIDEGYGADYWGIEGDIHSTFTTGLE